MNLLLFAKRKLTAGIALALNFTSGETLDPRITFSRTSNATRTNAQGLIEYAPHNLLTYSEQFDNAVWIKTTATLTANVATAPDGTTTADNLTATGADSAVRQQNISATAGQSYVFSVYLRADTPTTLSIFIVDGGGGAGNTQQIVNVTTNWQRFTVTRTLSTGTTVISAQIGGANSFSTGESVYIWGPQLNIGSLQPYYTTSVKNLLGYSQEFSNAAWSKVNSTIDATPVMGPFGYLGAMKLVENTVNTGHYINPFGGVVFAVGQLVTLSVYAKAGERTFLQLVQTGIGPAGANLIAGFDLTNGIAGTPNVGSSSIQAMDSGWYRCSFTTFVSTAAASTLQIRIALNTNSSPSSYTGDGSSGIYIFGAQLSDSASLDPYVYNFGAAPTSTAYYGPRFDYDPVTLAPKGLLIEESRTNLVTYSERFEITNSLVVTGLSGTFQNDETVTATGGGSGTYIALGSSSTVILVGPASGTFSGTLTGGTSGATATISSSTSVWSHLFGGTGLDPVVTSNFTTAPDGTLSADKIVFNSGVGSTTTDQSIIRQGVTTVIGTMYAGAIWLKGAVGGEQILFRHADNVNYTVFTLSTSWKRYDLVQTGAVTTTTYYQLGIRQGTGVGTINSQITVYIWGAQLEAGAFPTSYIPTTSAQVTRTADNASMTGTNFSSWYNQSEGTVATEYDVILNTGNRVIFDVGSGGALGTSAYNVQTATYVGLLPGNSPVNMTSTVNTTNLTNKIASGLQNNNSIISVNTVLGALDTSCAMPANATVMTIGASYFGGSFGNFLNGHIKVFKFFSKRFINIYLQRLTR